MVATVATPAFCPIPLSDSLSKSAIKGNQFASGRLRVKAKAKAPHKVNGTSVWLATAPEPVVKIDDSSSPPPRTFINQLPDWSMLLAAITSVFLAAEKQWTVPDWKPKRPDMLVDPFSFWRIVQDGLIFWQNRMASVETMETALNHVESAGFLNDGFGSTPEMNKGDLIWVVTKMQVLVDDRYPSCWEPRQA